ncbi:nitroreductase family protein [Streptomyces cavernicola]|uniref:Nitroreductase family protein n=1 Tax=Streptomyces cavernicola TaxID=3043613 RepID=A0ABT6SBQ7_9ACTN|nr:nitroreductase family protein [Streptomyces sp. B-S-A6]MDI3405635.1 nitroreductase family protein [Streptomyces sp. B-S-A6]
MSRTAVLITQSYDLGVLSDQLPSTADTTTDAVLEVLRTRSAVRHYTDAPVDDALLDRMLDAAVAAPTAANRQAWAFVAVRERTNVRRVRAFAPGIIGDPAAIVVACVDRQRCTEDPGGGHSLLCLAMAVENLLLAAHAQGLGACPVSSFRGSAISRLLELPSHIEAHFVVPIGHPAQEPASPPRRNRNEVISYERLGQGPAARIG